MRRFVLAAAVLCLLAPGPATAAPVLPPGFQDQVVLTGLVQPMVVRFSPDERRRRRRRPALGRPLPDAARTEHGRVHRLRAPLAPERGRERDGPDQRLVPTVPQPLGRPAPVRTGRRPLRLGGRRGVLHLHGLRAGRRPPQPLRRPARRRRRCPDRSHGRGRQPPLTGPADDGQPRGRPGRPRRDGDPRQPGHGRRARGQPALLQPRPEREADRRARPSQPFPHHLPARHERAHRTGT